MNISLGWTLDWQKFRIYLKEKYKVQIAYLFIGYIPSNQELYKKLQTYGFVLVFKPVIFDSFGKAKGNCDADLVLHTLIELNNYNKAIIVTSDGDFYSLVNFLNKNNKLKTVLSPYIKTCSSLLKIEAKGKIDYMQELKRKIGSLK